MADPIEVLYSEGLYRGTLIGIGAYIFDQFPIFNMHQESKYNDLWHFLFTFIPGKTLNSIFNENRYNLGYDEDWGMYKSKTQA